MRDFVQREFKEVTAPSPYFSHNLAENCRSVDRDWLSGERGQCCVIRPRPPESQDRSTECASFPRGCEKCGLKLYPFFPILYSLSYVFCASSRPFSVLDP